MALPHSVPNLLSFCGRTSVMSLQISLLSAVGTSSARRCAECSAGSAHISCVDRPYAAPENSCNKATPGSQCGMNTSTAVFTVSKTPLVHPALWSLPSGRANPAGRSDLPQRGPGPPSSEARRPFGSPAALSNVMRKLNEVRANNNHPLPSTRDKWQVLEFDERGGVRESTQTSESLGLQPRDVSLFAGGPSKQRATLAVRKASLLFRSERCQAVVSADRAFLFHLRRENDTVQLAAAMKAVIAGRADAPFEFRVLECLLAETVHYFEGRGRRLALMMDATLADISRGLRSSQLELQRLVPIQRKLTEMQYDVNETADAIQAVADDNRDLALICLTERKNGTSLQEQLTHPTPQMHNAAVLLDSYQRQIQSIEGALKEMQENMETLREVWHMQLDSIRNRIMRINLMVSIASFAMLMSTVPAAWFGMNLENGLEDMPSVFWPVVGACLGTSAVVFAGFYAYYRWGLSKQDDKNVQDLTALRDLLVHHLDDMEDIVHALRSHEGTGRKEFGKVVEQVLKDRPMSDADIDLLYRVLDQDHDGALEMRELLAAESQLNGKPKSDFAALATGR